VTSDFLDDLKPGRWSLSIRVKDIAQARIQMIPRKPDRVFPTPRGPTPRRRRDPERQAGNQEAASTPVKSRVGAAMPRAHPPAVAVGMQRD